MPTNLKLNDKLIEETVRLGHFKSKAGGGEQRFGGIRAAPTAAAYFGFSREN